MAQILPAEINGKDASWFSDSKAGLTHRSFRSRSKKSGTRIPALLSPNNSTAAADSGSDPEPMKSIVIFPPISTEAGSGLWDSHAIPWLSPSSDSSTVTSPAIVRKAHLTLKSRSLALEKKRSREAQKPGSK